MTYTRFRTFACLAAFALAFTPVVASAAEFRTGEQPSIAASETIGEDLYIVGGNITSAGAVTGDFMGAGGTVTVSGAVSSDVFIAGGTITILGAVGDDLRVTGGNVLLQSAVKGDAIVAGGQVNIGGPGIGGDVTAGGGVVRIDAPVAGDVRIAGGQVVINAPIAGSVQIQAEQVTLGSKANIQGHLLYRATREATMEDGAVVRGQTRFEERPDVRGAARKNIAAIAPFVLGVKFLMLLCGALLIGLSFRGYGQKLVQTAAAQPLGELGRGVLFVIVTPIASILLLVTVIGIPIGIAGLLAFIATWIVSGLAAPIVVGSVLYRWIVSGKNYEVSWKTILLGSAAYFLGGLIPFVGWIVTCGMLLVTLGAALKIKWDALKPWR